MQKLKIVTFRLAVSLVLVCGTWAVSLADGLAGEHLVTQRWHDLFSKHDAINNPAMLTEENYLTVRGAWCPTLQGSFSLWDVGVTAPIGLNQSLGVSWIGLSSDPVMSTTWDNLDSGTTSTYSTNLFMLSYALMLWNRLSVGANVNLALESRFEESVMGIPPGLDLGLSLRVLRHPVLGFHLLGASFQNILAPSLKSSSGTASNFDFGTTYSRNLRLSWIGSYWRHQISSELNFNVKDLMASSTDFSTGSAALENDMSFKLGGWLLHVFKLYGIGGLGAKNSPYWGAAGGLDVPSVNRGRELEVLYQYNNYLADGISSHTLYARAELGLHREELFARRLARNIDLAPNDLYNRALALFFAKKYWDAFYLFGEIISQYPDFFRNDWVQYYFAACQENLDMRGMATTNYLQGLKDYSSSKAIPYYDLGLMQIAYRNGDFAGVSEQFSKLTDPTVPDSLRYHAYYLMGEVNAQQKEWAKASQLFSKIPPEHRDFIFAQHSLAVVNMNTGDTTRAQEAFEYALGAEAKSTDQAEMRNRSFLLIGYFFLEQDALPKAVTALRNVPKTSVYYADALLGLGWAAVRAGNLVDCEAAATELIATSKYAIAHCEALLLRAYAKMMDKKPGEAIGFLNDAKKLAEKAAEPNEDTIAPLREKYATDRADYEVIAKSANELALSRSSALVRGMIDSLHSPQNNTKEKIDKYLKRTDEIARVGLLFRTLRETRNDIDYAMATASRLNAENKAGGKELKQRQELDKEIEKMKKEIEGSGKSGGE